MLKVRIIHKMLLEIDKLEADYISIEYFSTSDNSTGPILARFVSNWDGVGRGFLLDYRFNPCMVAG